MPSAGFQDLSAIQRALVLAGVVVGVVLAGVLVILVVQKAMARVKLAEVYDKYAERGAQFGVVKKEDVKLESYITRKALDGLYVSIAEEEAASRNVRLRLLIPRAPSPQ